MSKKSSQLSELEAFFEEGWITEVLHMVKSGKEATVYCCQADPNTGCEFLAAKVYRARHNRNFKNDTVYQEGKVILNHRTRRAVEKKTRFGREVQSALWIGHEFETLTSLHRVGANVPRPFSQAESAILIEYLGEPRRPAPLLNSVELEPHEVKPLFDLMLHNVRLWLSENIIHGDLSPFNILYWQGSLTVIDFPQAIDPRFNPHAQALLQRDIENLCDYWQQYGLRTDASRLTNQLWDDFKNSRLQYQV